LSRIDNQYNLTSKIKHMNQFKFFSVALILSMVMFSSCSKKLSYFTDNLYDEYSWSEEDLKQIQFYLSDDIVLYREASSDNARISEGKIKIRDGRKVEEIVFKEGTPGLLIFSPKEDRFAISFEQNDKYLMFGPNAKAGGRFVLLAKDWKKRTGEVTYGNETFYTSSASAFSSLLVDLDNVGRTDYNSTIVKGRKIE